MSSCWSSMLAVLGGCAMVAGDPDDEEGMGMRRRLIVGKGDTEAAENHLEEEVSALERALAGAETDRGAAVARRREAESRAEAAAAKLRAAEEEHDAQVEELLRTAEESDATDARVRELEERIKTISNRTSKWRVF